MNGYFLPIINSAFAVHSNLLNLFVGGVELEMLVDSGDTNNTDEEETWENLKAKKIKSKSKAAPVDRKL